MDKELYGVLKTTGICPIIATTDIEAGVPAAKALVNAGLPVCEILMRGENEKMFALPWVNALRKAGIASEIYPDNAKFKKQMQYANGRGFAYVAIVGESEMQENVVTLKNMKEGTQEKCSLADLIAKLN